MSNGASCGDASSTCQSVALAEDDSRQVHSNTGQTICIYDNMKFETPNQIENQNINEEEYSERRRLEILEQSKLEAGKKLDLALLILKRKQAAQLGNYDVIEPDKHKEQIAQEFQKEFFAIEELLKELGVSYRANPLHEDRGIYGFSFLVAEKEENLEKVIEAGKSRDDKTFGALMGYPKTAVDAYNTEQAFDYEEELPKDELEQLRQDGVLPFINFMPSREHWKEELNYAKENQKLIKERIPLLYAELVPKT